MYYNKTHIRQAFLIRKVEGLIDRAYEYSSGTYNRADSTHFSKSIIEFRGFSIFLNDCTWGVEITIKNGSKELASIYFTDEGRQRNVLIPRENWSHKWFRLFDAINNELPIIERNYYDDVYSEMELSYNSII